jgi:hypothetical protein
MVECLTPHRQVPVKVNAFVDENIKILVEVLNSIEGVLTLESCQGDGENEAGVDLYYGQLGQATIASLAAFANRVAEALWKGHSYRSRVALEWTGDKQTPRILLTMPPEDIGLVTTALGSLVGSHDNNEHTLPIDCPLHLDSQKPERGQDV